MQSAKLINILSIIGLCVLVAACSFKTVYNQLDSLIPAYVEGLVSLDDVLEDRLEQRTEELLNWHRSTQLIRYADWLQEIQVDLYRGITLNDIRLHASNLETFWYSIVLKLNDEMIVLLPLLNSSQREELFESIDEKNADYRNEYIEISDAEKIEQFSERMVDSFENWLGDLDDVQLTLINATAAQLQSHAGLRLQQRIEWQRQIEIILEKAITDDEKTHRLRVFFDEFGKHIRATRSKANQQNRDMLIELTFNILNRISKDQTDYFMTKSSDYIRMLTELSEHR